MSSVFIRIPLYFCLFHSFHVMNCWSNCLFYWFKKCLSVWYRGFWQYFWGFKFFFVCTRFNNALFYHCKYVITFSNVHRIFQRSYNVKLLILRCCQDQLKYCFESNVMFVMSWTLMPKSFFKSKFAKISRLKEVIFFTYKFYFLF